MKVSANSGLGAHLKEPEGFRSAQHNVSVRRSPPIQKSPQSSPDLGEKCLCSLLGHLQETVHVPVMGLKDGRGDGHRVIHQPSVAWLPFRHRHPQRYKDPAALSGRPTHKAGHQRSIWP